MKSFFRKNKTPTAQHPSRGTNLQRGQVVIVTTIFFLVVTSTIVFGFVAPSLRQMKVTSNVLNSRHSYYLAEAGMEDVLYRLKNARSVSASETLTLDGHTVTTEVADTTGGKTITSEADWRDHIRKTRTRITAGVGVAFNYGLQTGNGGLTFSNNASIIGNVYANGDIVGAPGASITGTAVAANSLSQLVDQANDTPTTPTYSINFRAVAASQDFAQSFTVSTSSPVNKIQLYIKKVGSPANATVRITNNSSGAPGTNTLTTGTLSASTVTTNYGWNDVVFVSNPQLIAGTTYWLVVDSGSQSPANYYTVGANTAYTSGTARVGQYGSAWSDTTPGGLDGYFTVVLGGVTSTIDNVRIGSAGTGDAWAHEVTDSTITGNLYCQAGNNNNKSCDTSRPDPSPVGFPISDANIAQWKLDAADGGTITGDYTPTGDFSSLGPKKIAGNLIIPANHTLTVTGTLWVTGMITAGNGAILRLDSTYDANSGVVISDGRVNLSNSVSFEGSGDSNSYVLLVTTSDCPASSSCGGANAVDISNNVNLVIINAQRGTISISNNTTVKEITAEEIILGNNVEITYESGLTNVNFSSGPGGAWNIVNWREIQ